MKETDFILANFALITGSSPCDNEDFGCAVHLLLCAVNSRKHLTTLDLDGLHDCDTSLQLIDIFFSAMSDSSLAFPYLERLSFGHGKIEVYQEAAWEVAVSHIKEQLQPRLQHVRKLGGLTRLRSLSFNGIGILSEDHE